MNKIFYSISFLFCLFPSLIFGQEICHVQGSCQDGIQIDEVLAESYTNCQEQCQVNQYCNFFTYIESNSFCKLMYNCSEINTLDCSDCFTGERDCPVITCGELGQCWGKIVDKK